MNHKLAYKLYWPDDSGSKLVSIPGLGSIKGTSSKSEKGLDFYKFLGRVCQIEQVWERGFYIYTSTIAEILCVKNVVAFVVCGYSTANRANFHTNCAGFKGQLILKCLFGFTKSTKTPNNFL